MISEGSSKPSLETGEVGGASPFPKEGVEGVSPRSETLVALDLETTGLNPRSDRIIDVGAVKFRGDEVIGEFRSLVNPRSKLSDFIVSLTGISQSDVDGAPDWNAVRDGLQDFIGGARLVGHNVEFDVGFLRSHRIRVEKLSYDTEQMARVALPSGPEFGLVRLAQRFGVVHDDPHRALSDALASRDLFLILLARFEAMPVAALARMAALGSRSDWSVSELASNMVAAGDGTDAAVGRLGIDEKALSARLRLPGRTTSWVESGDDDNAEYSDEHVVQTEMAFLPGGLVEETMPSFEARDGQREMAVAVARAIADKEKLIVEAGTGIGKSLAYLLPAALMVAGRGGKAVISTNTLNLQEQLLNKDFGTVREIVKRETGVELEAAQLKGRSNYLCIQRWQDAVSQPNHGHSEARVLSQCLNWLGDTDTGDRSELSLGWDSGIFSRISAEGCPPTTVGGGYPCQGPPCFMLKARSDAHYADVLIVNHALLISDMAAENNILPPHQVLVIDEAHHLRDVATRHLGFEIRESQFMDDLGALTRSDGMFPRLVRLATARGGGEEILSSVPDLQRRVMEASDKATLEASRIFEALRDLTGAVTRRERTREMRILGMTRITSEWRRGVDEPWVMLHPALSAVVTGLRTLLDLAGTDGQPDAAVINVNALYERLRDVNYWLLGLIEEPNENFVYWSSVNQRRNMELQLNGAPLDVSAELRSGLFSQDRAHILTGATISEAGSFERVQTTLGFDADETLSIGSPFDFKNAALILVPEDIPQPNTPGYNEAVTDAIHDIALATHGRTLALFTANSALNNTRDVLFNRFKNGETQVFGQGRDGPAARVMQLLNDTENSVALGAMSLWEGIDLQDASIDALVMTRLPFPVPRDPIHEARSENLENPFNGYFVPEAVTKFRQGFGRLIRSRNDLGVFVVLDRRIISKGYGRLFQKSIPRCTVRRVTLGTISEYVEKWLTEESV